MIAEALQAAGVEREQIECVAVGLGPGSYSGIRSAIALAQGWQLARDCKLLGVSSVECIAAQAQADGLEGRIDIVLDAQRQEFYLAIYHVGPSGFRELEPLRLASLAQVQARKREGALLVGPEATRWFPDGRLIFPTASMIGRLVLGRTDYVSGETLEPIYLRQTNFVKAPPPRQPRSSS
jgi:tRNA threonylcarbamoyl adenosine modification protein YeaZ